MEFSPAVADLYTHFEGDRKCDGRFHLAANHFAVLFGPAARSFKDQLIVYLQQHPQVESFFANTPVDFDHRQFDDIRSGALDRGIHRYSFRPVLLGTVTAVDSGYGPPPSEHRFGVALLFGGFYGSVYKLLNFRITVEIGAYELIGPGAGYLQFLGQSVTGHPVHHSEVDCFCNTALFRAHVLGIHSEDERTGAAMNVAAAAEGLLQLRI